METYRSVIPCVAQQVIENGFHVSLCCPDLHNVGNAATFHVVNKPSDDFLRSISQGNFAQISVGFHPTHEIQEPSQ
jgi:hypothetical protein